jgi:HEAT repeat protein
MNVEMLAEFVENMVLQHDYPGFEPRSLKLGLPDAVNKASAKVFFEALGHPSVYVKLAALRWFQERPGLGKGHEHAIAGLLDNSDPWVRREALRALERIQTKDEPIIIMMSECLKDEDPEVRKGAAKALGKVCAKRTKKIEAVIDGLKAVATDSDAEVRWKAEKALRILGAYDS